MRFVENARVYNTDNGLLLKRNVTREELGGGWTRWTTRSIYFRQKAEDYWMHVEKIVVDRDASLVDRQDYCYVVDEDYVKSFDKSTET